MSQPRMFHQQAVRAAVRIHEYLCGAAGRADLGILPTGRWNELRRVFERFALTQRRDWQAAGRSLISELEYQLRRLKTELEVVREGLPQPGQQGRVSPAGTIAADLLALGDEFEAVGIDLKEKALRVDTADIELEDIHLGAFQIVLHWEKIGTGQAYEVRALEPNCPVGRSDITHPHVQEHLLCEGAGTSAIRSAVASGRLLDFFVLVRQILQTYNGGSAYVPLSDWSGDGNMTCADCGCQSPADDCCSCERCYASVCCDCYSSCQACDRYLCCECSAVCSDCSHTFCRTCLSEAGRQLCKSCLERKEEPRDEEDLCEIPAADAVCLGEAAAPA
jgi:hypothetical protein